MRIASCGRGRKRIYHPLCLSVLHADCIYTDWAGANYASALPQRAPCGLHHNIAVMGDMPKTLCLSVLHADCIRNGAVSNATYPSLPQRAPCGLHRGLSKEDITMINFASACSMRIASSDSRRACGWLGLCLSVLHADCILRHLPGRRVDDTLPQRAPCGLHPCARCKGTANTRLCLSVLHADCIRQAAVHRRRD